MLCCFDVKEPNLRSGVGGVTREYDCKFVLSCRMVVKSCRLGPFKDEAWKDDEGCELGALFNDWGRPHAGNQHRGLEQNFWLPALRAE